MDESLCEVQQVNIILSCCHCLNANCNVISYLGSSVFGEDGCSLGFNIVLRAGQDLIGVICF